MIYLAKQENKAFQILLLAGLILLLGARPAFCLPQGATVKNGTATFSNPNENTLEINASNKAIINYQSFDVAKNETVIINLPSINNSVLNRVLGSSASQILGSVVCNGIFIIINEKGIFFGPNSNINVGSLIASTRDISDTDFMNSNYIFSRLSKDQMDALILNQGQINISDGGFGIMIAGGIENAGTIAAKVGTIALAAGEMVHVDISPAGRVSVAIDKAQAKQVLDHQGKPITDQIKNTGTLTADGGVVLFKASSVGGIFEKAINLEGYVKADKFDGKSGLVKVVTSGDVKSKATVVASRIEIGSKEEGIIPDNVEIAGGSLTATEQGIEILANNDITTKADITSQDADIILFADYDGNGVGSFAQLDGVIEATGTGNVYIDGSGTMTLGEVKTEEGRIVIGSVRAPVEIQGNPTYVHTAGDFQINLVEPGLITTTRADTLRYNPQGTLTLEATTGKVIDITNTPIEANKLTIIAAEAITINSAATTTEIYKTTGDMSFTSFSSLDNGQVNLAGINIDLTYFKANNLTLQSNNAVRTTPGIVIQGNEVKIKAQYFGTIDTPLSIEANKTYIQRLYGNIDIMDSLGLGTSILLRGPPDGFGAITYLHSSYLTLEAQKIQLVGESAIHLYGDITFSNFYCTVPSKIIYFEAGHTYTILGEFNVQGAYANLIKLISSVDSQQWFIDPRGQRNITYAWIKDSYNISPVEIYAELSTSRGNNYNWDPVITWEGDDLISPNSWSDPDNWDLGVTPGAGDDVVFGAGGDVDCDIDTGGAVTVNSITIQVGYSSTISITSTTSLTITTDFEQNEGTFNCSSATLNIGGNFTLAGTSTFNGNSSTINITGDFTIGGGSFTSTSGNLSIAGDLDIAGGFYHNNGTIILNGTLQSILRGATFYNLTKEVVAADTLYIQAGVNSIVVQGTLTLKGAAGQLLSLRSGTAAIPAPGQLWYIKFTGTTKDLDYLDVQDSYNYYSPILAPTHSTNSGHNWGWFAFFYWTGAIDTDWDTAGNWDQGSVPGTNDNVIIRNVANDPTIGSNADVSYIRINSGAALTIQDTFSLTARGDMYIIGTLTCQNTANVTVGGNWKNYGTFNCGTGLVTLNGLDTQTIYGNNTFYDLTKTVAAASTLYFEANKTQIITGDLTLQGAAGQLLSLRSTTNGTTWDIDVRVAPLAGAIDFVDVQDSYNMDSNSLGDILPTNSTNSGHNWRWFAAIEWNGAIDTDWATDGNWVGGSAPTSVDNVTIVNVANDPVISSDVNISYLYVNAGAVLTIDGANSLTTSGDMINYGTLTCTGAAQINIGGDIRMSTFNAGTSTITFNGTSNQLMYDILTGAWAFYNIVLNNTGTADNNTLGVSGLLAIDGDFTITDGRFFMAGLNAEIVGDIYISVDGSFVVSSILTWDYNSSGTSTIHSDSSQPQDLGDIRVNSGALNIEGNVVCTSMDIDPGVTVTMLSNSSLTLTGDGTPLTGTGTLDCSTNTPNTIQYTSNADTDIIAAGPVSSYYRLILGKAYDTLVANTTSEANYKCAVIDTSGAVHYAYFGVGNSSPGLIVKVDLSTFTRVGVLNLNYGENHLVSAVIDEANGFAYFGTYTNPGIVVKIDLSTFTRVAAVTFDVGENFLTSATIDTTDGFAYFGTYTEPGYIVKVDINPAHAFAKIDSISMGSYLKSAAIDTTAAIHYAYFGTYTQPGDVLKINLSDFTNTSAHSTLTLNTGEDYLTSCVIDTANGFIYFGTYTSPAQVIKIQTSDLTRQDKITMAAVTDEYFSSAVIDTTNGYAYFGVGSAYSNVVKIDVDPTRTFEKIADTYELANGQNNLDCAVMDTNNYAYFGSANTSSPGNIVQYSIDPLNFAKEDYLQTTTGEDLFKSAVVDLNKEYAYIATTGQAQVIKIRLSDFKIIGVVQVSDLVHIASSVIDEEYLYIGGFGSYIARIDLGNFTVLDSLLLDVSLNEYDFTSASIDLVNDFAYFTATNVNTAPSRIIKIDLSTFDKVETLVLTGYIQGDNSVIDTTGGLLYLSAYNGTNTEIIKVDVNPAHAFAVLDSLELDNYYFDPPIVIDNSYLYIATGTTLSRIDLATLTLTDSLILDYSGPSSATIDTTNGYAYFGASSGYPGSGYIYKIRLADFSLSGVIITQPEDSNLICPFIDDTYVYFCSANGDINPGRVYRFTLSDTTAATATLGDAAGQTLTIDETLWVNRFNVDWETFDPAINLSGSFYINYRSSWTKSSSATLSWSPAGAQYFADFGAITSDIGNVLIAEGSGDSPAVYAFTDMITSPLTIGTTVATNTANLLYLAGGRSLNNTGDITLNGGNLFAQSAYITLTGSIIIDGDINDLTGLFIAPLDLVIPDNLTVNGGAMLIGNAGSTMDINGNLSIGNIGIVVAGGGSETINVAGNWTNLNTSLAYYYGFAPGTSTVVFDDATQTSNISGNTYFYNLTSNTSGKNLVFQAGSEQLIENTTTLIGANLRSSVSGQYWYLYPAGSRNIGNVTVQDGYNAILPVINPYGSSDLGHNVNWFYYNIWTPDPEEYDQIGSFWYEEGQRKRQRYPKGKYRTIVVVYEGKVVMTPYDETGLRTDEAVTLVGGQSSMQDGEVK